MARGKHRPKANLSPQHPPQGSRLLLWLCLHLLGTQAHQSPETALSQLLILGSWKISAEDSSGACPVLRGWQWQNVLEKRPLLRLEQC